MLKEKKYAKKKLKKTWSKSSIYKNCYVCLKILNKWWFWASLMQDIGICNDYKQEDPTSIIDAYLTAHRNICNKDWNFEEIHKYDRLDSCRNNFSL